MRSIGISEFVEPLQLTSLAAAFFPLPLTEYYKQAEGTKSQPKNLELLAELHSLAREGGSWDLVN